jgi:hypothetical protein
VKRRRQAEFIAAFICGLVATVVVPELIVDVPHEMAVNFARALAVGLASYLAATIVGRLYALRNPDA